MKNKIHFTLVVLTIFVITVFAFAGCGNDAKTSDNDSATATSALSSSELKAKAEEMNNDKESFYGTWVATSDKAEYLYGNLEITINEDGSFTGNVTQEDFSGTWEKAENGIEFSSVLLSGELYFGDTCKMVIYDEYDTKVTLKKVD